MQKISVIIPIIRDEKARRCIGLVYRNAGIPPKQIEILAVKDTERIGCPKMVKRLTAMAKHDLICFLGDDTMPGKDFLKVALEEMWQFPDGWGLVGLTDNTGRQLPTHWLAHKKLLKHLDGEFFHTGYQHCFCDNELMARCAAMGRYRMAWGAVVLHDHPLLTGAAWDDAYKWAYSEEVQGADHRLFLARYQNQWKLPEQRTVIAILGMHRSGTSCLAGCLQAAGLNLGNNLTGYNEDIRVYYLHEDILKNNWTSWKRPPEKAYWFPEHFEKAGEILAETGEAPWGFKDPRTLFTIDGWRKLADIQPVGIFRHPESVAQSLEKRDGMNRRDAFALWNVYNERLLAEHAENPFPVLNFDISGAFFREEVERLAGWLNLPFPAAARGYFDENQRHHRAEEEPIPEACRAVYEKLIDLPWPEEIVVSH